MLGATLWQCQNVGGVNRRMWKVSLHSQFPAAGASPISLPQCSGRVLKLEKSISVGQTGNPGQCDGSSGFKERPPGLSGPCQHLPAHFFPAKCLWKMLSWQFLGLFPLSMELFQSQVRVGWKDPFCPVPLASRFPSLLSLLLSQERQS